MNFLKIIVLICLVISPACASTYTFDHSISTLYGGGSVSGMTFDPAGNLYTSFGNGILYRFNANHLSNSTTPDFNYQSPGAGWGGLATDTNGNLYALNSVTSNIVRFDSSTLASSLSPTQTSTNPSYAVDPFSPSSALAIGGADNIYISNMNTIKAYGPAGTFTLQATLSPSLGSNFASNFAFDSGGNLYAPSVTGPGVPGSVSVFSSSNLNDGAAPNNTPIGLPATPGPSFPCNIAIDQSNTLYVADSINGRILVYQADGTLLATAATGLNLAPPNSGGSNPLVISPDGQYIYIATSDNNIQVYKISSSVSVSNNPTSSPSISPSTSLQRLIANQNFSTILRGEFSNALLNSGPRAELLAQRSADASTNLATSIANVAATTSSVSNNSGTVHAVAGASVDVSSSDTGGGGHSFTSSAQRQSFTHLSNQLPFLQFQSLHSMVDPITPSIGNNAILSSSPFDKQKPNLKPVFLSNDKNHLWVQPFGGMQRLNSYDQVTGMTIKNSGSSIGVGHNVSKNVTVGVLAGGSVSTYTLDQNSGNGNTTSYYTGVYGGYKAANGFNLKGSVMYGQDQYISQRNMTALSMSAKNNHRGWNASFHTEVGYTFKFKDSSITPYVGGGLSKTKQDGYQEYNAYPFNLSVPDSVTKTLSLEIGSRFESTVKIDEILVKSLLGFSVSRDAPLRKPGDTSLSFTDSTTPFTVAASNSIKTYANITAGAAIMASERFSISGLITGKFRKHEYGAEAVLKASYALY